MARQEESSKSAESSQIHERRDPVGPFWMRIPRGWIILILFLLAWIGVFLVWNGFALLARV